MLKRLFLLIVLASSALQAGPSAPAPTAQASEMSKPWWEWDNATGDWFGYRTTLADKGIEFTGSYSAEVWGNTTGGIKTGSVYTGLLAFGANIDLSKLVGWQGASLHTNWLWLSGRDASADLVGNFMTISNIAGFNTLRMQTLYFEQLLFDDKLSIRAGQMSADSDFVISDYGALFLNGTFGWPPFMYTSVPNGGPGYPMGTLGVRVAYSPTKWFSVQSAAFQGNVFEQDVNRHGFRYDLNSEEGYFWINEAAVSWNQEDDAKGLPGKAKAGAWFDTANFADSFEGSSTVHTWDYGFYGIVDQMLYREPTPPASTAGLSKDGKTTVDAKDAKEVAAPAASSQGLGWFGRIGFEPEDRNFLGFYFDTGLVYTGLIPTRDADKIGVSFAYSQLSNGAIETQEDAGSKGVGAEMLIEASYQAVVTPWFTVQPDVQYVINPGGNQDLPNAFVVGGRATITF